MLWLARRAVRLAGCGVWLARRSVLAAAGMQILTACGGMSAATPTLPAGTGRAVLVRECLNCHELDALELFSPFYGRAQWRSLIVTMRDNGAEVADAEVDVLAAYLSEHFGTGE